MSEPEEQKPVWCVVANVKETREHGESKEIKFGTKHFFPGTKVYCYPVLWGDGYEQIKVIGRHRGSHKYVTMIISSSWLENWRTKLVYSPEVIARFEGRWNSTQDSRAKAEEIVHWMLQRQHGKPI